MCEKIKTNSNVGHPPIALIFGKTIPNPVTNAALVEGDIAYTLQSGLDRYIDVKLTNGNFNLDEIDRIFTALDSGQIEQFDFAVQGGIQNAPTDWLQKIDSVNAKLSTTPGKKLIKVISAGDF